MWLTDCVSTLSLLRLFWGDLESWGDSCGWSDCGSVALSGVPAVTDVPDSDWEIVEPQSFSLSQ